MSDETNEQSSQLLETLEDKSVRQKGAAAPPSDQRPPRRSSALTLPGVDQLGPGPAGLPGCP